MNPVGELLEMLPPPMRSNLQQADQRWQQLRQGQSRAIPQVVQESRTPLATVDWDVVVCGGTLGVIIGTALAQRGWRVLILERGILRGRDQEWNISRAELAVFVELGLLTEEQLQTTIASEFNPNRIQFMGRPAVWVKDVLNVGVDPVFLLDTLKTRFLAVGGHLQEQTTFSQVVVHPNGVAIQTNTTLITARLMLDVMGHFSPVVAQARNGQQPAGVCLVVGTCAQGLPHRDTGDLLVSLTPIQDHCQYFWEAFPARDGRTTYMFTYGDLHPQRPSLQKLFTDYWQRLPEYQETDLANIQILRALFGMFPSYAQSPLNFPWARILPIGDSSGSQSPLSFGGFGALIRHLRRLDAGIHEALSADMLTCEALKGLQPYQPNLSATWLFQESMRAPGDRNLDPQQINQLLQIVFQEMAQLGDPVLKPFLQDIVQFPALTQTLFRISLRHPQLTPKILGHVGLGVLLKWFPHYINLGVYHELQRLIPLLTFASQRLSPQQRYVWQRRFDSWIYGSGLDILIASSLNVRRPLIASSHTK
ncbi:MAG: FAD-binding oxidoreductase [Acaryochloridaceae cyanobacterium CSU_3_4]|nr:FAD-binding oxidoreductase [Acaryochloridaceae cyanobacterium CSU_3_4]